MTEDEEILEFFRNAVVLQALVHTGRHPDCPCEEGKCIYPECTCALPNGHQQSEAT